MAKEAICKRCNEICEEGEWMIAGPGGKRTFCGAWHLWLDMKSRVEESIEEKPGKRIIKGPGLEQRYEFDSRADLLLDLRDKMASGRLKTKPAGRAGGLKADLSEEHIGGSKARRSHRRRLDGREDVRI